MVDWYDVTSKPHERTFPHDGRLASLPNEWERELAALWRLDADVNNGAYLQFLENWGRDSYVYASQALKKMGASKMAEIIDQCQALVDEHFDATGRPGSDTNKLLPNQVIDRDGEIIKEAGSILPEPVIARIYELSSEFMDYPDNIAELGLNYYRTWIGGERDS